MLLEWLRRNDSVFESELKDWLFTENRWIMNSGQMHLESKK